MDERSIKMYERRLKYEELIDKAYEEKKQICNLYTKCKECKITKICILIIITKKEKDKENDKWNEWASS